MGRPRHSALLLLGLALGCHGRTSPSAEPLIPTDGAAPAQESSPAHAWLEQLSNPHQRVNATKHLTELADGWNSGASQPPSEELRDLVIEALTRAYVEQRSHLDALLRVDLLRVLAECKDARAVPAFKALYMLGALGDDRVRDGIVALLDEFEDPAARFVAAQTIDRLTPNGDAHVVTALQAVIARNKRSGDRDKQQADRPLRQVAARLAARSMR